MEPELKWGIPWDPSIVKSYSGCCPICGPKVNIDHELHVVGINPLEDGMLQSSSEVKAYYEMIIECPSCEEKFWFHMIEARALRIIQKKLSEGGNAS